MGKSVGERAYVNTANRILRWEVDRLRMAMQEAADLLAERRYGNSARSPGHNARLVLEAALRHQVGEQKPYKSPVMETHSR